jgi:tRNA(Ile)-lysidine synthase
VRTAEARSVSASEAKALFSGLQTFPVLVLAVSGGPDSTALMLLAARWRDALKTKPKLVAVTVDHGLRRESKREAAAVARVARKLRIAHRTLRWTGRKPATGLQEAARAARYRLLGEAARKAGATCVVTAHTLDDQAETVLIRMTRGSGIAGLAAMAKVRPLPTEKRAPRGEQERAEISLVRPLLEIPKLRLVATLRGAKISYADDPSNRDPRFTRARLRGVMTTLAQEGLSASRLALLARRLKRADTALEAAVERAMAELAAHSAAGAIFFGARGFRALPAEIALRLLGRAVNEVGDEGPVELGKLEALKSGFDAAQNGFRRTLAGAIVTLKGHQIIVERAPPRGRKPLTKRGPRRARRAKTR